MKFFIFGEKLLGKEIESMFNLIKLGYLGIRSVAIALEMIIMDGIIYA